jgi:GDPmannose 4,6-dehydratase
VPKKALIATGEQYSVPQFVDWTAAELRISLRFQGEGRNEQGIVTASADPEIAVEEMVAEDLQAARRFALLKAHGHAIPIAREPGR